MLVVPNDDGVNNLLFLGFSTATVLLFIWAALSVVRKQSRFLQTATAFFGIDALLTLIGLPVLAWAQPGLGEQVPLVPWLLFIVILIWLIDVFGYILSRSLGVPYVLGVLLVVAYQYFSYLVRELLFTGVT